MSGFTVFNCVTVPADRSGPIFEVVGCTVRQKWYAAVKGPVKQFKKQNFVAVPN